MTDDNLSDTQQLPYITWNEDSGIPIPTFHCKCGNEQEGFSICLKCNPQTYSIVGITSNERLIQNMSVEEVSKFAGNSVLAKEIWNKAIEAAAQYLEKDRWATVPNIIRELKK